MTATTGPEARFTVNGRAVTVQADPETPLLTVLREHLELRGSRFGCGLGLCGACNVLVDGTVVASCDTPVWSVEGRSVVTVEGLAGALGRGRDLHPVQQALIDHQAVQCGFCISGIAVRAAALLEENPRPGADEVAAALDRNLCRCGVQRRIIRAVVASGEASA
jgi:nicotinate dehydrogenase subunit A